MKILPVRSLGLVLSTTVFVGATYLKYSPGIVSGLMKKNVKGFKPKKIVIDKGFALDTTGYLITNFILAQIILSVGAFSLWTGMQTGFWMWLGFYAAPRTKSLINGEVKFNEFLWTGGYHLLTLMLAGALLAVY